MNSSTLTGLAAVLFGAGILALFAALIATPRMAGR